MAQKRSQACSSRFRKSQRTPPQTSPPVGLNISRFLETALHRLILLRCRSPYFRQPRCLVQQPEGYEPHLIPLIISLTPEYCQPLDQTKSD